MSTNYDDLSQAELLARFSDKVDQLNDGLKQQRRTASKAHLIGPGFDPNSYNSVSSPGGEWLTAIVNASSRDAERQAEGKLVLSSMGVEYHDADGKATLGTTDATGGYIVPNNQVAGLVEVVTAANPMRRLLNVVAGVRGDATDIPFTGAPSAALVVARGETKPNYNVSLGNYTATLYTLAKIYDVANQLLRHSAGAAEQMVRSQGGRSIGLGEMYYVLNGSGTNEPKGLLTSIAAGPATFTSAHTAADNTVAGSVRAAISKMVQALALRNYEATAILMNSGDVAHAFVQGADTAGFWIDENGGTRILGLPVVTTTAIPSKTAIVGDFKAATLFVGDQFRVDVTTEAGDRFDKNLTGFRFEEEIGFNADPPVLAGAFQAVTSLIP